MKIVILNDYMQFGGTEVQMQREIKNFSEHGHEVYLITFDSSVKTGYLSNNHFNFAVGKNKLSWVLNKFFINQNLKRKLKRLLKKWEPDYIHVNNIYACPKLVYKVIAKYKTVQTIRDYGAVCPKKTCVKNDFSECKGYRFSNCKECLSGLVDGVKIKYFKKITKIKKDAVDKFVCPSVALTKKCLENGYNIECVNNPFDFSKSFYNNKTFTEKKIYLYYGAISKIKGVFQLIKAFSPFCADKEDVRLYFIGKVNESDEKEFFKAIGANMKFEYKGYMSNEDILKMLDSIYCTVVPSLWLENYPNTVLESVANFTLVLGANRGGIAEMIGDPQLLFNVLDTDDIKRKLEYSYDLSADEYIDIVRKNYVRIQENNTLEKYYQNLTKIYDDIIDQKKR